jgi:hypothetical protein
MTLAARAAPPQEKPEGDPQGVTRLLRSNRGSRQLEMRDRLKIGKISRRSENLKCESCATATTGKGLERHRAETKCQNLFLVPPLE